MLHINNNSVICPLVLSAPVDELLKLHTFLHNNSVELYFFDSKVRMKVLDIRTYVVPKKCLKSFENLFAWVCERVNKELSNIKQLSYEKEKHQRITKPVAPMP